MSTLSEKLNVDGVRPQVLQDCTAVLEQEVNKKSGISGFAVKKGFQVVKRIQSGRLLNKAIDGLLDDFADALDPYYQSYLQNGQSGSFSSYLAGQDDAVTESLLSVTDVKRKYTSNQVFAKSYDTLRPMAARNVRDSVPAVGQLMQKYAFSAS
ncbi:MAG: DUF6918 family protein [Candidatus Promineifilaceae bacterium]